MRDDTRRAGEVLQAYVDGEGPPEALAPAINRYISGHDALMRTLASMRGRDARRAERAAADAFTAVMHAVAPIAVATLRRH